MPIDRLELLNSYETGNILYNKYFEINKFRVFEIVIPHIWVIQRRNLKNAAPYKAQIPSDHHCQSGLIPKPNFPRMNTALDCTFSLQHPAYQ